jgi:hypothetical protein
VKYTYSVELSFLIGNIIMFIGTTLLIRTVVRNKSMLNGYNLAGSALTFIALLFLLTGFILSNQLLSVEFSIITVLYWMFIVVYKLKYRGK